MRRQRRALAGLFVGLVLAVAAGPRCAAAEIYVDNLLGSDAFDGESREAAGLRSGPVRTIRRGLQMARRGDTIEIANRGEPYYEQISLNGRHHSGFDRLQFTIIGNGAVVSGARLVPPFAWVEVAADLWRFSPDRKGDYLLLLDEKPVPEFPVPAEAKSLPEIPAGQWAAWRGAIYFQAERFVPPAEQPFAFAHGDVGVTLTEVHNVTIIGLTFRHFRLDGVSAHSQCRGVVLEDVRAVENGRAGLFAGETSQVEALDCAFTGNRKHNVLIRGRNAAIRAEPELAEPPEFVD